MQYLYIVYQHERIHVPRIIKYEEFSNFITALTNNLQNFPKTPFKIQKNVIQYYKTSNIKEKKDE